MSFERARNYIEERGFADRVMEFEVSSATVEQAALAAGTSEGEIVKTLSFMVGDGVVLVCAAGDTKIDNAKFKAEFHAKAKMVPGERVEELVGHAPEACARAPFELGCPCTWMSPFAGSSMCTRRAAVPIAP